ncbi:MAG: hypothetical protein RID15_08485 [Marinovum algicola]|jgi:hypothetical protein|uniref:Uncharacterized protein n=1 Tax=Marinovum algicola TaxID=42444 RepID=A0A975W9S2_9RHOB|nr:MULTISPECIES: hypothetical protein [Marinovum]MDD9741768.1 hypothetical protein [Marinovum sp. SP66]SEJ41121.1 hypothetical protein SAMN04487940_105260 [Marinovum algicola]SLN41255.1 hypothetical protein MAA5396_02006 [Marinovum algicola]
MASIALICGSTLGALTGLLGWLVFGMSATMALELYLALGLIVPAVATLAARPRRQSEDAAGTDPVTA